MNDLKINSFKIEDMIYEVRGHQVMLDKDLASLYQCKNGTKTINQAVKRHITRFPKRFMFQITQEEFIKLQSQIGTANINNMSRTLPYAFTEQGVAMLATILKTEVAEQVSIAIMDAFVLMRKYIATNNYNQRLNNIETKVIEHDNKFDEIFSKLETEKKNHLFFEGQIYDAYSLLMNILNEADKEIIIIDNYAGKELFDILKDVNKTVKIITKNLDEIAIKKYQSQYNNLEIILNEAFHDRFIIIDNKILYHCGASFKDLGKKCFSINRIEDKEYLTFLLSYLKK